MSSISMPGLPPLPALPALPPLPALSSFESSSVGVTQSSTAGSTGTGAGSGMSVGVGQPSSGRRTVTTNPALSVGAIGAATTTAAVTGAAGVLPTSGDFGRRSVTLSGNTSAAVLSAAAPVLAAQWSPHGLSPDTTPDHDLPTSFQSRVTGAATGSGKAKTAGKESRTPSPLREPTDAALTDSEAADEALIAQALAAAEAAVGPRSSAAAGLTAQTRAATAATTTGAAATATTNSGYSTRTNSPTPDAAYLAQRTPSPPPSPPPAGLGGGVDATAKAGGSGIGTNKTTNTAAAAVGVATATDRRVKSHAAAISKMNSRDLANVSLSGLSCEDVHSLVDELLNSTRDILESGMCVSACELCSVHCLVSYAVALSCVCVIRSCFSQPIRDAPRLAPLDVKVSAQDPIQLGRRPILRRFSLLRTIR